jgi:hypothetical protein
MGGKKAAAVRATCFGYGMGGNKAAAAVCATCFGYGMGGNKAAAAVCATCFGYGMGRVKLAVTIVVCEGGLERSPALADKLPAKAIASNDASILCFINQLDCLNRRFLSATIAARKPGTYGNYVIF